MSEKKVCKICDGQILEDSFAQDSKLQYFFHTTCLEKLRLLRKLKNANLLSEEEFKYVELFFELKLDWDDPGIEFDEIDNETDKLSKKYEIELDQDKKLKLDIISNAFNTAPQSFISSVLLKEMDYIEVLLSFTNPKGELEDYYEQAINIDELKKLVLVEEVL